MNDRRAWPRLPLAIPVFVHGSDENGKDVLEFSSILNISAGGVLFASRKRVRQRCRILLEIPAALHGGLEELGHVQRKFQARILRITRSGRWYLCAAKFARPMKRRFTVRVQLDASRVIDSGQRRQRTPILVPPSVRN